MPYSSCIEFKTYPKYHTHNDDNSPQLESTNFFIDFVSILNGQWII